jgi:hypothetical protein
MKQALILALLLSCMAAYGQDANYWSAPYGAGGFFVPGATIARNDDSGVLFYNPALLAYNTKNAANISGNIYNLQRFKVNDGAGSGLHLKSGSTGILPVVASNTLYLKLKSPISIAYALINNPVLRYQVSQRKDGTLNVLNDSYSPGNELFVGQYVNSNSVDETQGVLSIGKSVSKKLALGISFTANFRKQTYQHDYKSRTLVNDNTELFQKLVSVTEYYLANTFSAGLGIKTGLSYSPSLKHHFGLLLSLPLIHLHGTADLVSDFAINNLKLSDINVYFLASSKQTKLKARYKTPFSTALGYTYHYGKGQLYFAAEYFTGINEYNMLTPRNEYFIRPDTGSNNNYTAALLRLKTQHKPIVNFSVAASFPFMDKLTGYCSLRTDFNYLPDKLIKDTEGFRAATATWNLYHLQLGANFKKRKFNLRTGLLVSYGKTSRVTQSINFDNPNENNLLEGDLQNTTARRLSAGLMMAYIHNF